MADGTDISVGAGIEGVGTGEESPSQAKIQERPPAYASVGIRPPPINPSLMRIMRIGRNP
eukprot:852056-Rhodomonas_salina.1